jgi:hypothetical protein
MEGVWVGKWIPCGGNAIAGDVVRWVEVVWVQKGRGKRKKPVKAGARDVTAEVKKDEGGGFLSMTVLKCEIVSEAWEPLKPFKKGEAIKRKRLTLEKGGGHRMIWSDEGARSQVASRFLKGKS